jgi:O-antigen polymerase
VTSNSNLHANQPTQPQLLFVGTLALYLLVGAHFLMRNAGGSGLDLPVNLVGWIFAALLIAAGLWQIVQTRQLLISRFFVVALVGVAGLLIPLFYPGALVVDTLPRIMGLVGGLLLYFALLQFGFSQRQLHTGLNLVLACAAIEMSLSLVQFFLLTPGNWIGYDTASNRPFGVFQQPNVMASFTATALAISLYLAALKEYQRFRIYYLGIAFAGAFLINVLQSRSGQLGCLGAILLLTPLVFQQAKKATSLWLGLALLGFAAGYFVMYYADSINSVKRLADMTSYGGDAARLAIYGESLQLIADQPFSGVGYGNFEGAWQMQYASAPDKDPDLARAMFNLEHPHNEILLWTVEGGLLPLAGLLVIGIGFIRLLFTQGPQHWRQSLALLALVLPIAFHTQTEFPFYTSALHWLVFIGLLYFIDASLSQPRQISCPNTLVPATGAWLLPLVTVPFMLTGLHTQYLLTRFEAEPETQEALLTQVINPFSALDRLQRDVMGLRFIAAMESGDKAALNEYVSWAETAARHKPRLYNYSNRIQALRQLGRNKEADELLAEAKWRFTDSPELAPLSQIEPGTEPLLLPEKRTP